MNMIYKCIWNISEKKLPFCKVQLSMMLDTSWACRNDTSWACWNFSWFLMTFSPKRMPFPTKITKSQITKRVELYSPTQFLEIYFKTKYTQSKPHDCSADVPSKAPRTVIMKRMTSAMTFFLFSSITHFTIYDLQFIRPPLWGDIRELLGR